MTIHMREADAERDFAKVLEHVAAGDEVQVDRAGSETVVVVSGRGAREPRHVDDVLDRLRARALEDGAAEMDESFAEDVRLGHERLSRRPERSHAPDR